MAYDVNHLLTVGHAKQAFDTLKSAVEIEGRFDNINNKYNLLTRGNLIPTTRSAWHFGAISDSTGAEYNSSPARLHSDYMPMTANTRYTFTGSGYFCCYYYKSDKTYIGTVGWLQVPTTITTPANTGYVRFVLKYGSAGTTEWDNDKIAAIDMGCYPAINALDRVTGQVSAAKLDDVSRRFFAPQSRTMHGITFTWDDATWSYTLNGTSTATSDSDLPRASFYDSTIPAALKKGGIYKVTVESDSNDIYIVSDIRKSQSSSIFVFVANKTQFIYIPENTTHIWMRVQTTRTASLSNAKFAVQIEYQEPTLMPVHIPVMAYNVGGYNHGYAPSAEHVPPATSQTLSQLKEFFRTHQADIIATEEGQEVLLDTDLTTGTNMNDAIYTYQYPYYATACNSSTPFAPSLHSRYPIIWQNRREDSAERPYTMALLNVHGIPVAVAAIHFGVYIDSRTGEFDSVITRIRTSYPNIAHIIVMGDFNAGNEDDTLAAGEYKAITDAGFHSANGGWWGLFNTYRPTDPHYIDSVVTTANIDITTYDVPDVYASMPSDHLPLMCELVLYPTKDMSR